MERRWSDQGDSQEPVNHLEHLVALESSDMVLPGSLAFLALEAAAQPSCSAAAHA